MRFSILLVFFSFFQTLSAQIKLDSVQIEGKWMYVYPEIEPIRWIDHYYDRFELDKDQYAIWLDWKLNHDSRADEPTKQLYLSIQREMRERFMDSQDSLSNRSIRRMKNSHKTKGREFKSYRNSIRYYAMRYDRYATQFPIWYESNLTLYPIPVLQSLPDGWYVNYFAPIPVFVERSEVSTIDTTRIARLFYLKNNQINGELRLFDVDGSLLSTAQFNAGFKNGPFSVTSYLKKEILKVDKDHVSSDVNVIVGGYENDVYQGKISFFHNGHLTKENYFSENERVGVWMELTPIDSIVYPAQEPKEFCDSVGFWYNEYPSLDRTRLTYFKDNDYHVLSKYYYEATNYSKKEEFYFRECGIKSGEASSARLKDYINVPSFKDTLRVYYRKTGNLKAIRYYDPLTKYCMGETYYPNGKIQDKSWMENSLKYFAFYDTLGVKIYGKIRLDSLNRQIEQTLLFDKDGILIPFKPLDYKQIDGFDVVQVVDGTGKNGFTQSKKVQKENVTYYFQFWDKKQRLVFSEFKVNDVRHEVYHSKKNGSVEIIHEEQGNQLIIKNSDWTWTRQFDTNNVLLSSKLLYRNQPFNGRITYRAYKKWGLTGSEKEVFIGGEFNEKWTNEIPSGRFETYLCLEYNTDFWSESLSVLKETAVLQKNAPYFKGTLSNDQLTGEVKACSWNGKPYFLKADEQGLTGTIRVYSKESEVLGYDYSRWVNPKLNRPWNKAGYFLFNLPYLEKEIPIVDGKVNGTVVRWSPKKDTLFSGVFKNGISNGPFQHTSGEFGSIGNYKDGHFLGDLLVFQLNFSDEKDTVLHLTFSEEGELMKGNSHHFCSDCIEHYLPMEDRPDWEDGAYSTLANGNVLAEMTAGPQIIKIESNTFGIVSADYYWNDILSYSLQFKDTLNAAILDLEYINWLYKFHIDAYNECVMLRKIDFNRYRNYDLYEDRYRRDASITFQLKEQAHYFIKYAPNGQKSRAGKYDFNVNHFRGDDLQKTGEWNVYSYDGLQQYSLFYHDTVVDFHGKKWKGIGIQSDLDSTGRVIAKRLALSELENFECSQDEYYTQRDYLTLEDFTAQKNFTTGWLINRYDNGAKMSEGMMKDGLPVGVWKYYSPDGTLNEIGKMENGLRHGNWLTGDLSDKAYFGETCIDPNQTDIEFVIGKLEREKEIIFKVYNQGVVTFSKTHDFFGK